MIGQWHATGMLVCLLGLALWCDIATRRVPNWLIGTALFVGLCVNFFSAPMASLSSGGVSGVVRSSLGTLVGLVAMLPLYLCRGMGGGDIKLMAAVGFFLGPMATLGAVLLTFVAGGVLSLAVALWTRSLERVVANLWLMCMFALTDRSSGFRDATQTIQPTGRLPYALAIATGTGLQLWLATQEAWPFK